MTGKKQSKVGKGKVSPQKKAKKRRRGSGKGIDSLPEYQKVGAKALIAHSIEKKENKQDRFLAAYALCGTVSGASRSSGVESQSHYRWIREETDYIDAFKLAKEQFFERLKDEAVFRATQGLKRFKFFKGESLTHPLTGKPYAEEERSDNLLMFLIKGEKPDIYKDRTETTNLNVDLTPEELSQQEAQLGVNYKPHELPSEQ